MDIIGDQFKRRSCVDLRKTKLEQQQLGGSKRFSEDRYVLNF